MTARTKLLTFIIGVSALTNGFIAASTALSSVLSETGGAWPSAVTWLLIGAGFIGSVARTVQEAVKPVYDRLMKNGIDVPPPTA
jgi:hypothetical protein